MDNIIEALLKQENIIPLFYLEKTKLNFKGIYLLMIKENSNLDEPFKTEIDNRKSNIFYLGKAERTLDERLQEECRGFRHGTFFRGVGALLNCKPPKGSLRDKKNQNNYKFSTTDSDKIIEWMNNNLSFSYVRIENNIDEIERKLINKLCPLLNDIHNPNKWVILKQLRKECREFAKS